MKKKSPSVSFDLIWASLLGLIIFTLPINLFLKLSLNHAYVNGFFIDYLIPKIYLHDIFILAFIIMTSIFWLKRDNWWKKWHQEYQRVTSVMVLFVSLVIFFLARQYFTSNLLASAYGLAKLIEAALFALALVRLPRLQPKALSLIKLSLIVTIVFQLFIALYQFHYQKSFLPYQFLGETNLSQPIGLARGNFMGSEKVLAYGTTAHPNILAGIIVIDSLLWLLLATRSRSRFNWFILLIVIIILGITTSISAGLALIFALIGWWLSRYQPKWLKPTLVIAVIFFLLTPGLIAWSSQIYRHNPSLFRRQLLNEAALKMWQQQPIFGVGLDNFTVHVERFSHANEIVRFPQPAHHLGLLLLAESGLLGLSLFAMIGYFLSSRMSLNRALMLILFAIIPLASLDHYLVTQSAGLMTLVLAISLTQITANH